MNLTMGRVGIRKSGELGGRWQMSKLDNINTEKGTKHSIIYIDQEEFFYNFFNWDINI